MTSGGSNIRVSDQDREAAAEEIRHHYAAGRLDSEELDARLNAAYAARTEADLAALKADLPALSAVAPAPASELEIHRAELWRRLLQRTGGTLGFFGFSTVVWLMTGANSSFWPKWILPLALIPLVRGTWQLYGPAPNHAQLEADLDRHERRDARRDARERRQLP